MHRANCLPLLPFVAFAVACSEAAAPTPSAKADAGADGGAPCGPTSAGKPCDDGNPCTTGDQCGTGGCAGAPKACDDGLVCTVDSCGAGGACDHALQPGWCRVTGSGCVAEGAAKPGDPCRVCTTAKTAVELSLAATACDDGNACTTADACDLAGACSGTVAVCDDKNACTTDSCDAKAGCKAVTATGPCVDGDPCSTGDVCADGSCKAGSGKLGCDDANSCTIDSCKAGMGCVHALTKANCDDGEACTKPDACTGGVCVGVKTSLCPTCDLLFGTTAGKLTQFLIGTSGKVGQGIDVDGDPKTCAPESNCGDGVDNSAAVLAGFLNTPLVNGVNEGTLTFVAEFAGYAGEGVPFTLNLYYAEMTKESKAAGCKLNSEVCSWQVGQSALSAQCKPKFSFSDATVKEGKLTAGTKNTVFAMDADLLGAKDATLYVKGARIQGAVEFAADKKTIVGIQGVLGGAVPQTAVIDMVNSVDASLFGGLGLSKQEILALITQILVLDIDVDGDGGKESASIGIRFSAVGAVLVGTVK